MYRWVWADLATDQLLDDLSAGCGSAPIADKSGCRIILARMFEVAGGVPISDYEWVEADLADRLLRDVATTYLARVLPRNVSLSGVAFVDSALPFHSEAVAARVVPVNWCSAAELAVLPIIGPATANRIVAERNASGSFHDLEDLSRRVGGFGEDSARRLRGVLSFHLSQSAANENTAQLGGVDAFVVAARVGGFLAGGDPVKGTLGALLAVVANHPSPAHRNRRAMPVSRGLIDTMGWFNCDWTAALIDEDYLSALPDLLAGTTTSIDMCMFHVAVGVHTRPMIDALLAASQRGVAVRVLLDQDRPDDPYNSTVINTAARRLLEAGGVPARYDPSDRLLHSKYLVLDSHTVVIGSHNWSAGSFASSDDVSAAIRSASLASSLTQRFETLWNAAQR